MVDSDAACIGAIGCRADTLLDSIAFRREIISESLAVAEGVKRTR